MSEKTIRIQVMLSQFMYRKLTQWTEIYGKAPSAFASFKLSELIEEKLEVINQMKKDDE